MTEKNSQPPSARLAGWVALLARIGLTITGILMAYALLITDHQSPWLTWSIIGFQVTSVATVFLWIALCRAQ